MRPYATSVCGLKLLVYAALSYECMRPEATSVCGLKLLVYAAVSYCAGAVAYTQSTYRFAGSKCAGTAVEHLERALRHSP